MEIAIPLIALGSFYVISNQDSKSNSVEGFKNALPNTADIPVNYPIDSKEIKSVNKYKNPNQATDKYFAQNVYTKALNNEKIEKNEIDLLTGEKVDNTGFKHNNMQPFFGSRARSNNVDQTGTLLDNTMGGGSLHIKKTEQAPLFDSETNMHWINGMPNMNDYMMSRVNPSTKMSNVKPWDEQRVGPGLGKEPGKEGTGGFNSGMMYRDIIKEKTVDDLRINNNPKESYSLIGHEGIAHNNIKYASQKDHLGKVEKHLPDTYYTNTPDRWFTTNGAYQKDTYRSENIDKPVQRETTNLEFYGNKSSSNKVYVSGHREQSKRIDLPVNPELLGIQTQGVQPHMGEFGENRIESNQILPNNRCLNPNNESTGGLKSLVSAAVTPILDILRPTRKEEIVENMTANRNISKSDRSIYINNPADRVKTTRKETYEDGTGHLFINGGQDGTGYMSNKITPTPQQRNSTYSINMNGAGGASNSYGPTSLEAAYNQENNPNKQVLLENRPNQGGQKLHQYNTPDMKVNKLESDIQNNRNLLPTSMPRQMHNSDTYPKMAASPYNYKEASTSENRIDPGLLKAFKDNPYTKSLNSCS